MKEDQEILTLMLKKSHESIICLKADLENLPLDPLTCMLQSAIDDLENSNPLSNKVRFVCSNLFLFKEAHWQLIGKSLKMLGYTTLDIVSCNFDLLLVIPSKQKKMNWSAFTEMLAKTSITQINTRVGSCEIPSAEVNTIKAILKKNAINNMMKERISLKNMAAFFVAKENLPTSTLPNELIELVEKERILCEQTLASMNNCI